MRTILIFALGFVLYALVKGIFFREKFREARTKAPAKKEEARKPQGEEVVRPATAPHELAQLRLVPGHAIRGFGVADAGCRGQRMVFPSGLVGELAVIGIAANEIPHAEPVGAIIE